MVFKTCVMRKLVKEHLLLTTTCEEAGTEVKIYFMGIKKNIIIFLGMIKGWAYRFFLVAKQPRKLTRLFRNVNQISFVLTSPLIKDSGQVLLPHGRCRLISSFFSLCFFSKCDIQLSYAVKQIWTYENC